jgi:hypothetical protein
LGSEETVPILAAGASSKPARVVDGEVTTVDFAAPTGSVYGTVTKNGVPAAGYQVTVLAGGGIPLFNSLSDASRENGEYVIENVPPGEIEILLQQPGNPVGPTLTRISRAMPEKGNLIVDLAVPTNKVSGVVLSKSGAPISGANVVLTPESFVYGNIDSTLMFKEVHTDPNGLFVFEEVEDGSYWIEASAQGYGQTTQKFSLAEGESKTDLRLDLPKSGSLAGKIYPPAGMSVPPMVGIKIQAEGGRILTTVSGAQQVGKDGSYRIDDLAPGTYTVSLQGVGSSSETHSGVEIREGETTQLDFHLPEPILLTLDVRDLEGNPVYGAEATILDSHGMAVDPSYSVSVIKQDVISVMVAPGVYTVIVEKPGYRTTKESIDLTGVEDSYRRDIVLVGEN